MRRIGLAVVLGLSPLSAPSDPETQHAGTVYRIGVLAGFVVEARRRERAFSRELRERGYAEGQNIIVEWSSSLLTTASHRGHSVAASVPPSVRRVLGHSST